MTRDKDYAGNAPSVAGPTGLSPSHTEVEDRESAGEECIDSPLYPSAVATSTRTSRAGAPGFEASERDDETAPFRAGASSTPPTVAAICHEIDAEHLFERHYDRVVRRLRRSLPVHLAEELAAQTIAEAYACRAKFDAAQGVERVWVDGIANNLRLKHYRTEAREVAAYGRAAIRNCSTEPFDERVADRLDAENLQGAVARALSTLTMREYQMVTSYYWYELSYDEIATALGVREGTVKATMFSAKKKLRVFFSEEGLYND